jgi:hypothetical protein
VESKGFSVEIDNQGNTRENETMNEYENATIVNIRRGKGERSIYIYAELRSSSGQLLVSATLDYILKILDERL